MKPLYCRFCPSRAWCPLPRSYNLTWVHNSVGPEMCFGHRLIDSGISSQVGFVPIALGGTTLAIDWIPGRE